MGNIYDKNNDCGCDGNCCPPKRRPKWMAILSIVILIAAISIVTVKLSQNHSMAAGSVHAEKEKSSCCDTAAYSKSDTIKKSSCCPESDN